MNLLQIRRRVGDFLEVVLKNLQVTGGQTQTSSTLSDNFLMHYSIWKPAYNRPYIVRYGQNTVTSWKIQLKGSKYLQLELGLPKTARSIQLIEYSKLSPSPSSTL